MHFKKAKRTAQRTELFKVSELVRHHCETANRTAKSCATLFFVVLLLFALSAPLYAAIRDRVVAFVDNIAITLNEFEAKFTEMTKVNPGIKKEEVLDGMVNRTLMLRETKKMRLEAASEEALLKEYVDLKIRTFIRIKDEEVKEFYEKNSAEFHGKEYEAVRDEIETYLIEKELNKKLKAHIDELRGKACVQIQFQQSEKNTEN
jgi:hypothetical protein